MSVEKAIVMDSAIKERVKRKFIIEKLSKVENLFHFVVWWGVLLLGCFNIHKMAYNKETMRFFKSRRLIEDTMFGIFSNSYDPLWNGTVELFIHSWIPLIFYLFCSITLRANTNSTIFMSISILLTLLLNYYYSSFYFLCIEISIFFIISLVSVSGRKGLVWIVGLTMLYNLKNINEYNFFDNSYIFSSAYPYLALLITRAISVGLILSKTPKYTCNIFLEMGFYYLYFPAIIGCRMMSIKRFLLNIYSPYIIPCWKTWIFSMLKVFCYLFVWNIFSRLVPVNLIFYTKDIKKFDIFAIIAAQLFNGLHFYMSYFILYKTVFLVTMSDGFLTADGPECIAHIALYSQMWRTFDRGLYIWLKENIYKPTIETYRNKYSKHLGTLASFGFVIIFHGVDINNILWVFINLIQIYSEQAFKYLFFYTYIGEILSRRLYSRWFRRFVATVISVSFLISIYAFAVFSIGLKLTNEMYMRIFSSDPKEFNYKPLLFFLVLYSHSQIFLTVYMNRYKTLV